MKKLMFKVENRLYIQLMKAQHLLRSEKGEGFIDTAIKILMAVVIGALLLAGLYALIGETVLPTLKQKVIDMFNYGK